MTMHLQQSNTLKNQKKHNVLHETTSTISLISYALQQSSPNDLDQLKQS